MKLNSCQTKQLPNLINWYFSTEKHAILHGRAGTGKTFLMEAFLAKLPAVNCFIGAETNEAVEVIAKATNYKHKYGTVCNLLCLRLGHEKHEKVLKQYAEPNLDEVNLIIIDEGSMLDDFKLDLLLALNVKILFIGHKSQLPQILKNQSLSDKCLPPLFERNIPIYELFTVERNKGDLLSFCNLAEESIYDGRIILSEEFRISKNIFNERFLDSSEGLQSIMNTETSILCYTNNATDTYNALFRRRFFGTLMADSEEFLPKDKLILRTPTACFKNDVSRCNGVSSVLAKERVWATLQTNTRAEVIAIRNVSLLKVPSYLIKVQVSVKQETFTAYIYVPQDEESFNQFKSTYYHAALFEKNPVVADKKWKLYHDIERIFGNTKHAYARTIHTAQGSTLDNVIVDDGDIDKCQNIFLRKKLRYVAYSRAKFNLMRLL